MQHSATAYTANNSMNASAKWLWPAPSPNLNSWVFYFWGTVKGKVYVNNPHSLQEMKENIQQEISTIARQNLNVCLETTFQDVRLAYTYAFSISTPLFEPR